MAERWQQWMPFYIDRFRGSMDMQALGPMGRSGFIYLLATAWQTDDCTLPADPAKLATASGFSEEEWALYAPRILEKFEQVGDRLRNQVLFKEWTAARDIFEKRRSGAERTNSRSPRAARAHTARSADTGTETGTSTETEVQELAPIPSEPEPLAGDASPPAFTLPLTGSRTHTLTEADVASYQRTYPAVDVRQELREVCQWLDAHPDKHNRSIVGLKQRLVRWMSKEQDKGGKHGSTAHGQTFGTRTHAAVDRQRIAHDSIRTAAARRYGLGALHPDGPDTGPLPQPDAPARNPGHVPRGVGGAGSEVRASDLSGRFIEGHP
ncbi:MAG TPA: hypothetical protein VGG18_02830 [Granulicella sp.]